MNKKKILEKIEEHLNSVNLSQEDKKQLIELKEELIIANKEKRILYLIAILIKIITGFLDD